MPLKDGDIVTLDYEGRTDGILFDTTLEKVAKKEDALVENRKYAPITVIVGEGRLVPGFENDLKKAKVGKVTEIKIAPEDAYGPRDTKLIETMSVSKFRRVCPDAKGFVGEELNIEGRPAILANVYGSRVRIDSLKKPKELDNIEDKIKLAIISKDEAVSSQNYEKAAKCRDNERRLKKKQEQVLERWSKNRKNNKKQYKSKEKQAYYRTQRFG